MKILIPALGIVSMLYACSPATFKSADSTEQESASSLLTTMKISDQPNGSDRPTLKFTVKNQSDTVATFCKWHTPFEPLISKYLDIKDSDGQEVDYKGAMAKRIMPPPADSYLSINPGDSLSVDVDLTKGYAIEKPGTYTLKYSGGNMSGLVVKDSLTFTYKLGNR
jgi:hypothetical protein